jgi:hypothetical protein
MTIAPSETVAAGEIAAPEPPSLPVTSEMVALDAIDAFDAMWASAGGAVPDELTEQATPESTDVSPLDESSLGSLEGASIWSNDITEASEQLATPAPGAVAPALDLPAWLADDHDPEASAPALEAEAPGTLGGDASRAAESPSEFTPAWLEAPEIVEPPPAPTIGSIAMTEREALENDRLPSEPVDEAPSTVARAPAAALRELPGAHVSAALTRLAERIRVGEIDVSSTAPDASDAAMLAAVLAVLLGGSSR